MPKLVRMSNGVLACSYGRPASCIMFSIDGGKTWPAHHVVSERTGFNYTSIREISDSPFDVDRAARSNVASPSTHRDMLRHS